MIKETVIWRETYATAEGISETFKMEKGIQS